MSQDQVTNGSAVDPDHTDPIVHVQLQIQIQFANVSRFIESAGNDTAGAGGSDCWSSAINDSLACNGTGIGLPGGADERPEKVYWALLLVLLPFLAVFGNILVILSVYKERSLQSVTNYFIVSLAFADLLVAGVVMPFAVYFLVNVDWELSETVCDFWIAFDVTLSTASILNLVAISIDRYFAVTKPIQYSKHRNNNKRVALTIAIVWIISVAIGSPIVLGLNTSPDRIPQLCIFYNSDFIIYSSLGSFYIPCVLMVFLYYRIFKAIHDRAKKPIGSVKTGTDKALVIENTSQTTQLKGSGGNGGNDEDETSGNKRILDKMRHELPLITEADAVTNAASGSAADEEDGDEPEDSDVERVECQIIKNEQTTEFSVNVRTTSQSNTGSSMTTSTGKNANATDGKKSRSRFNLGRKHKSSKKKREKLCNRRERKATKTLAIVLGVFLFCWVPFFTCNIMDAICMKLDKPDCRLSTTTFLLTTWLGYMNSIVNPVIYTIFNLQFREAFKKILCCKSN